MNSTYYQILPGPRDVKHHPKEIVSYPRDDHSGHIINKPWGYEFQAFDNFISAVWFLHIRNNCRTSFHCHAIKKTCLILLSGQALVRTMREDIILKPHDSVLLGKGAFHSTMALSLGGIYLLEIEIPSCKSDLHRLQDLYSRKDSRYEPASDMDTAKKEQAYNHFELSENGSQPNRFGISVDRWPVIEDDNASFWAISGIFAGFPTERISRFMSEGDLVLRVEHEIGKYVAQKTDILD
jgi:hypothetical protein